MAAWRGRDAKGMKTVWIGMMGAGNVGQGVWALLESTRAEILHRHSLDIRVKKILVRDASKKREKDIPPDLLTQNADEILKDKDISLVVECMGGEQPATTLMVRALESGKIVVTANKMAVALNWHLLDAAARRGNAGLHFEASVCGAIPIIRTLNDSLQVNRIDLVMGIVNGTTNYILSKMSDEMRPFDEVLLEAQALGLAEPDPASDVEGFDAAYKLSVLASLAFHARIPYKHIFREGISRVQVTDIAAGKDLGYRLKLLAVGKRQGNTMDARVHPAFVPEKHPLASVQGAYNAVFLHGDACGDMMLYGRGAGATPTAGAILSDVIYALKHHEPLYPSFQNTAELHADLSVTDNWQCGYYIRFSAANRPGVLGHIATKLGEHGVSISTLFQRKAESEHGVPIIVITHKANEKDVHAAISAVDTNIAQVESSIRVEGI